MAVTLQQQAGLVEDATFQGRCLIARVMVAVEMLLLAGSYTEAHVEYARNVLMSPWGYPYRVASVVAAQPQLADDEANGTGATDQQIKDQVENAWLYMA